MTTDAKLLTAAAELGRDRVLLDPLDGDILLAAEELSGVTISERWFVRQTKGVLEAYARGEELEACPGHPAGEFDPMGQTVYCELPCSDVAPIVRSVAAKYGLA